MGGDADVYLAPAITTGSSPAPSRDGLACSAGLSFLLGKELCHEDQEFCGSPGAPLGQRTGNLHKSKSVDECTLQDDSVSSAALAPLQANQADNLLFFTSNFYGSQTSSHSGLSDLNAGFSGLHEA